MEAHQGLNHQTLQNFINNVKIILLCLTWNCLGNSKFNIRFLFQNLFKCYK
jgi:hypothetical protein